jgi:hypothetical protein
LSLAQIVLAYVYDFFPILLIQILHIRNFQDTKEATDEFFTSQSQYSQESSLHNSSNTSAAMIMMKGSLLETQSQQQLETTSEYN